MTLQGRRVADGDIDPFTAEPGDYGLNLDGGWRAKAPNGLDVNLDSHEVLLHEDGTITVSPSILVSGFNFGPVRLEWHGFLERGVWREC